MTCAALALCELLLEHQPSSDRVSVGLASCCPSPTCTIVCYPGAARGHRYCCPQLRTETTQVVQRLPRAPSDTQGFLSPWSSMLLGAPRSNDQQPNFQRAPFAGAAAQLPPGPHAAAHPYCVGSGRSNRLQQLP